MSSLSTWSRSSPTKRPLGDERQTEKNKKRVSERGSNIEFPRDTGETVEMLDRDDVNALPRLGHFRSYMVFFSSFVSSLSGFIKEEKHDDDDLGRLPCQETTTSRN